MSYNDKLKTKEYYSNSSKSSQIIDYIKTQNLKSVRSVLKYPKPTSTIQF